MVWTRWFWVPLSSHPEAQANSTSNTTCWLRLGATQMHEAVAEIATARDMTRLGATLAAESTVHSLSRRLCPTACVLNLGSPW